jgi:hypothetical protein
MEMSDQASVALPSSEGARLILIGQWAAWPPEPSGPCEEDNIFLAFTGIEIRSSNRLPVTIPIELSKLTTFISVKSKVIYTGLT